MRSDRYAHRFDIGDVVWAVNGPYNHKEFTLCLTCEGEGRIEIEGARNKARCPDCPRSEGRIWFDSEVAYYTMEPVTVGQVRVAVTTERPWPSDSESHVQVNADQWRLVEYMATETGIGSGRVYREARLHPSEDAAMEFATGRGWVSEREAKTAREPVPPRGDADSTPLR